MQAAGDIWRGKHNSVWLAFTAGFEFTALFPEFIPALFYGVGRVGCIHGFLIALLAKRKRALYPLQLAPVMVATDTSVLDVMGVEVIPPILIKLIALSALLFDMFIVIYDFSESFELAKE